MNLYKINGKTILNKCLILNGVHSSFVLYANKYILSNRSIHRENKVISQFHFIFKVLSIHKKLHSEQTM